MKTVKKKIWIIGVLLLCAAMFYTVPVAAAKKTGWKVIKGKTYYFNNDGTMHKGFLKLNGKKYYFGEDGAAKKGFFIVESSNGSVSYFAQKDYSLVRNKWLYVKKNQWYYFDNSGRGMNGWFQIDEKVLLLSSSKRKANWLERDKRRRILLYSGRLYKNQSMAEKRKPVLLC